MNRQIENKGLSRPSDLSSFVQGPQIPPVRPCKGYARAWRVRSHPGFLALANAAPETDLAKAVEILGLANDLQVDSDGWALIPFGESRHDGKDAFKLKPGEPSRFPKGVIQRFTREDAQAIVDDFKSTWSRIKRAVVGLPIFKGHPDAPAFANVFPDKNPRGTIADMQVGDAGLRLKFVLTSQGADDVEGGWNQFSPFWPSRIVGLANDGATIAAPFKLFSVGIVPRGNIPGLSLINAASAAQIETDKNMKLHLLKLLALLGHTVAADASDDNVIAAANAAEPTVNALLKTKTDFAAVNSAKADLETAKTKLEGEVVSLTNAKGGLESSITTEKTRAEKAESEFKAERKERALLLVNAAIVDGRVPANERDAVVLTLCNAADFTVEAQKLADRRKVLKTSTALSDISAKGKDVQDRTAQMLSLVNARMESPEIKAKPSHERYDAAFAAVMADPANAALVGAMKKPEVVTK